MRNFLIFAFTLIDMAASGQKKGSREVKEQRIEKYYDYQWNECEVGAARFYTLITKTDSGWHRQDYYIHDFNLQMDGTYEDSACKIENGTFYYFYPDKTVSIYGHYLHGKRQGLCESFNRNGVVSDSAYFENDNPVGVRMGWYSNGAKRGKMTLA